MEIQKKRFSRSQNTNVENVEQEVLSTSTIIGQRTSFVDKSIQTIESQIKSGNKKTGGPPSGNIKNSDKKVKNRRRSTVISMGKSKRAKYDNTDQSDADDEASTSSGHSETNVDCQSYAKASEDVVDKKPCQPTELENDQNTRKSRKNARDSQCSADYDSCDWQEVRKKTKNSKKQGKKLNDLDLGIL